MNQYTEKPADRTFFTLFNGSRFRVLHQRRGHDESLAGRTERVRGGHAGRVVRRETRAGQVPGVVRGDARVVPGLTFGAAVGGSEAAIAVPDLGSAASVVTYGYQAAERRAERYTAVDLRP